MTNYTYSRIEGKYGIFLRDTEEYGLAFLVAGRCGNEAKILAVIKTTPETLSKSSKRAVEILNSLNNPLKKLIGSDEAIVRGLCEQYRNEDKAQTQVSAPKMLDSLFDFLGRAGKPTVVLNEQTDANNTKEAAQPEKPQSVLEEVAKLQATQKNKVTQEDINDIINKSIINASTVGEKTTFVRVTLPNGFEMTESSSCVDPANYNFELGKKLCLENIKRKLWMLEGYVLQQRLYENKVNQK
jgi:hypothetical protein